MTATLTRATESDIPDLCTLLETLFSQEAEFSPDHTLQHRALTKLINTPDLADIFVAKVDNHVIGMVSLLYSYSTALDKPVATLEDMIVLESHRKKGIGQALITHALAHAKKKGCGRITLLTDSENEKAHRFYEKEGFVKSEMVPFRYHI